MKEFIYLCQCLLKEIPMDDQLNKASEVLKKNGVIIFPSDTVWGVGCLLTETAIQKLYLIKKREPQKPTGIYVTDLEMAQVFGQISDTASELAQKYWPGPLSIVVKATDLVPNSIKGDTGNISMRIPNHPILLELLSILDKPLVQTSANFAGENPPTHREEINPEFEKLTDYVLVGESLGQLPSTIVDATSPDIKVLRVGPIALQ